MNTVWIVMPILIVLMFLLGTDLNARAFADVARKPRAVLLGMLGWPRCWTSVPSTSWDWS